MRLVAAAALLAPAAVATPLPAAPDCPVFPASSVWNKPVHKLPLQKNSTAIVKSIGARLHVHADFGSGLWDGGPIRIPMTVVGSDEPKSWVRPRGWTSADAAGLPILPGLARYDEVARGVIDHALRFTVRRSRRAYVYPARHFASTSTSPSLPPMGLRLRLRASFPVAGFPPQARVILRALKRYGMIVADDGSSWYVSGVPDPRWDNDQLHSLHRV
ncbi:MAG TPA: hypothetical protein VD695_03380 [Gaiellaceae bacterium]|nr:hypothetical protein [Gaiellaceae bacterium]